MNNKTRNILIIAALLIAIGAAIYFFVIKKEDKEETTAKKGAKPVIDENTVSNTTAPAVTGGISLGGASPLIPVPNVNLDQPNLNTPIEVDPAAIGGSEVIGIIPMPRPGLKSAEANRQTRAAAKNTRKTTLQKMVKR